MGTTGYRKRSIRPDKLTDKQRRFAFEYMVDGNGTRAAVAAGFSERSACTMSGQLLKKPLVKAFIEREQYELACAMRLTIEEVARQLYYCATRDIADFTDVDGRIITDVSKLGKRARSTIDGIEQDTYIDGNGLMHTKTKLKLTSKLAAVELAMKFKGMFMPDKYEVEHSLKPNWDELIGIGGPALEDPIQKRLEQEGAV